MVNNCSACMWRRNAGVGRRRSGTIKVLDTWLENIEPQDMTINRFARYYLAELEYRLALELKDPVPSEHIEVSHRKCFKLGGRFYSTFWTSCQSTLGEMM